jgi:hypothetical protein
MFATPGLGSPLRATSPALTVATSFFGQPDWKAAGDGTGVDFSQELGISDQ